MSWNFVDLTGKRFGKLTILERAEDKIMPNGTKAVRWKCKCDCGTIKDIYVSSLRNGQKSCGCVNMRENLIGKQFGELTVIAMDKDVPNTNGRPIATWVCMCSCGKRITVRGGQLRAGKTKSCGHLRRIKASETHSIHGKRHDRIYGI